MHQMEQIIPYKELGKAIASHYRKPKGSGRRPVGIEHLLRIHFMPHWFNLSDPDMQKARYDMPAMGEFAGTDLGNEAAPDETTICKFRHYA